MKNRLTALSAFINPRLSVALLLLSAGILLALIGSGLFAAATNPQPQNQPVPQENENSGVQFGQDYHHDISPPLSDVPANWPPRLPSDREDEMGREARMNPQLPMPLHVDEPDPVVDHGVLGLLVPDALPALTLNFDGIVYPGVSCNCAPPDPNGAIGATQYVQMVNMGYQVFNKTTGASIVGPNAISSLWFQFGGACENGGFGDPVVLYDKIANRWIITQFASATGGTPITDECIAVSSTSDATQPYFRYGFHLGSNFFDYPHLGVWPDGYYMSMNVFNSGGTALLGPQAFAFDRSKMLTGAAATFVTPGITGGSSESPFLPSDFDGSILPNAGIGNPFVSFPGSGQYKVRIFHADFTTPANTTFTQIGAPAAAGFSALCSGTRSCVPQSGTTVKVDGIGDRLMFRAAYRKFSDGHESIVSNFTVSAGSVSGIRWFELRGVTTSPTVFQESTYQPDATWRWMGSAAMDRNGDLALGFSASSSSITPQIRYAGRLSTDPVNNLSQGEATFFGATGASQTGNGNRWGDYSAMTIDPVDDCTFWYTQEYSSGNNWRTRIGNLKFSTCFSGPTPTPTASPTPTPTPRPTPTPTPTPSPTPTPTPSPTPTPTPTPLPITISLPVASVDVSTTTFTEPVTTSNINPSFNLVAFQGDFAFDSSVVDFQASQVTATGLTSNNWNVSANVLNTGPGTTKTLRISAFSNDGFTPLSGAGTLFTLNMTRVSSTNGANTPLVWAASPNDFEFIDTNVNIQLPNSTPPGSITITSPTTITISGNVDYCSNATLPPVPGVTLTLTGSASASTSSNGSGNYSFTSLASGGSYTITPSKTALTPGSNGIDTVDVVAVQRHFLNITPIPAGCRLTAANVNGDSSVNTTDVVAIQRFFIGMTSGIANVGKYNFNPTSRSYPGVSSDQTNQNYDALVFGDVASNFVHRPEGQAPGADRNEVAPTVATVMLPTIRVDQFRSNVASAVTTSAIDARNNLVGFQGDCTFDERSVRFEDQPVEKAGLTSGNWDVSGNVLPGPGPIRTLRISAYSTDFVPLSGEGTLFELKVKSLGQEGQSAPLIWAPANGFIFIDAELHTQRTGAAPPGMVRVVR